MAGLTNEERETIVRYENYDNTINVYSTERGWWAFCERAGMKLVNEQRNGGNVVSKQYLGPWRVRRPGMNLRSALGLTLQGPKDGTECRSDDAAED